MIIVATGTPWSSGKGVNNDNIADELLWSANALRWFIVVGWIIYPAGYLFSPGAELGLGSVSIEYRYMDWIITVPLMALKFPSLVGKDAITDEKFLGMGFTGVCFSGALIMIGFGYLGESGALGEALDDAALGGWLGLILGGVG